MAFFISRHPWKVEFVSWRLSKAKGMSLSEFLSYISLLKLDVFLFSSLLIPGGAEHVREMSQLTSHDNSIWTHWEDAFQMYWKTSIQNKKDKDKLFNRDAYGERRIEWDCSIVLLVYVTCSLTAGFILWQWK